MTHKANPKPWPTVSAREYRQKIADLKERLKKLDQTIRELQEDLTGANKRSGVTSLDGAMLEALQKELNRRSAIIFNLQAERTLLGESLLGRLGKALCDKCGGQASALVDGQPCIFPGCYGEDGGGTFRTVEPMWLLSRDQARRILIEILGPTTILKHRFESLVDLLAGPDE